MSANILSAQCKALLARVARQRTLIALDYDGSLAPIRSQPELAVLPRAMRAELHRLAQHFPVALVSGRSVRNLMRLVREIPVVELIGNHGREWSSRPIVADMRIRTWHETLRGALRTLPGVLIEAKTQSLAIHFRNANNKPYARRTVRALLQQLVPAPIVVGGKQVLNLLPSTLPSKGSAIAELMSECCAESLIFVGDDQTDESAFALASSRSGIGVRVGRATRSHASHYVNDQPSVRKLLSRLSDLRSRGA